MLVVSDNCYCMGKWTGVVNWCEVCSELGESYS